MIIADIKHKYQIKAFFLHMSFGFTIKDRDISMERVNWDHTLLDAANFIHSDPILIIIQHYLRFHA